MPSTMLPLCVYLKHCFGQCSGISFIDATSLKVCHNVAFVNIESLLTSWQNFGRLVLWFKSLHLVVNECGELLNLKITPGNTDDRKPVPELMKSMFGKVFADRGYVSKSLAEQLFQDFGLKFFAKPRRNMKNQLMRLTDKLLSRKRKGY